MRKTIHSVAALLMIAGVAACGGGEGGGDEKDVPGVDASGTADTEVFTNSPDTTGVPVAGQGGTQADSQHMGTPGAAGHDSMGAMQHKAP